MCSIGEEDFGDEGGVHAMIPETAKLTLDDSLQQQTCKRCNLEKCVLKLSHKKDPECGKCFMNYVRHKFKAALGSTKIVKRDATVLLVADEAPESVVMLDMIKNCIEQNIHQRLHVKIVGVLMIDEGFLGDNSDRNGPKSFYERYKYLGMPLFYTNLARNQDSVKIIDENWQQLDDDSKEKSLKQKLSALKSLTSQQEYLHSLRVAALSSAATELTAEFVFTPEISLDLAKLLLTNISLGRGASVALDVGFCDTRHVSFRIIRPMRDLTIEEIHHYLTLNGLSAASSTRFGLNKGPNASIQNLTAQFVDGLQQQFCGTVSTVFKTGERLKGKNAGNAEICKVCRSPLDFENSETLFATEYSRLVSEFANQHISEPEFIEEKAKEAVRGAEKSKKQNLCHSCRNIFMGVDDENLGDFYESLS
ncbi:cytoplasmic tRNA 2-thiolation protein 2 [Culicoides brevitarsis]|uniref:cytoplasmic tRNA 2-thiolation protein 2 n=1 Tax=Culicoides brevitarsis TaxID=469753 RepID=UPI00307B9A79